MASNSIIETKNTTANGSINTIKANIVPSSLNASQTINDSPPIKQSNLKIIAPSGIPAPQPPTEERRELARSPLTKPTVTVNKATVAIIIMDLVFYILVYYVSVLFVFLPTFATCIPIIITFGRFCRLPQEIRLKYFSIVCPFIMAILFSVFSFVTDLTLAESVGYADYGIILIIVTIGMTIIQQIFYIMSFYYYKKIIVKENLNVTLITVRFIHFPTLFIKSNFPT